MKKPELVAFIMTQTMEYKKTHLMEKHKAELEVIAAAFHQSESPANGTGNEPALTAQSEAESAQLLPDVENGTNTPEPESEMVGPTAEENALECVRSQILAAYEENKKLVKGKRLDKNEFQETVIEKVYGQIAENTPADPTAIAELTISAMKQFMEEPIAFVPMNDNEQKMLETIPLLADYVGVESQVNGMGFLHKVKELHNIEVATSRALMVSLKRKKYITIGGGRKTFIVLLERGIRHLRNVS